MKICSYWTFPVLALLVMASGCGDLYLQNYYGSQEHVYVVANAFDSTTSVQVTAKWDLAGKVTMRSRLVPRDTVQHKPGMIVDMPNSQFSEKEHTITPTQPGVTTFAISYDKEGRLSQEPLDFKIRFGFCCQNICNYAANCGRPYNSGTEWYCPQPIGYCRGGCLLTSLKNCSVKIKPDIDKAYITFIQASGPAFLTDGKES